MKGDRLVLYPGICLVFYASSLIAQCGSPSLNIFNPAGTINVFVSSANPWNSTTNGQTSNDAYTTANTTVATTQEFYAYTYGYTFGAGTTICGVRVRVEKSQNGGTATVTDLSVRLYDGSSYSPNDYASGSAWGTSDAYTTYGGSGNLWGWSSLSVSTVNASAFGLRFRAQNNSTGTGTTCRIDHVEMTVYANEFLPIELKSFDALKNCESKVVDITWVTATETNNDYFTIERSKDGLHWEEVVKVNGAGTSSMDNTYFAQDKKPFPGRTYYRLKQRDFDGKETISDALSISTACIGRSISIFNDLLPNHYVIKSSEILNNSVCHVFDLSGKCIKEIVVGNEGEINEISLGMDGFAAGAYIVRVVTEGKVFNGKFLVQ